MSTGLFTILVGIFIIMCYVHDCQDDGKYICSMDALFGLPRKKAAGVSYREPLHGDLFFNNQSAVDQFVVENSEQSTSMPNVSEKDHELAQLAG